MKRRIERSEMGRGSWSRRASFSDAEARNLRFEPAQHLARRCETRRQFHACAHRVRERVQHQQHGSPHEQGGALAHRQRQRTSSTPGARSRDDLSSHSSTAGSSSAISQNLTRGEHGKVASPFHTPTGDTHPPGGIPRPVLPACHLHFPTKRGVHVTMRFQTEYTCDGLKAEIAAARAQC